METPNPYTILTAVVVANLILWSLFSAPLIVVLFRLLRRVGEQTRETANLVRDFAAYAASRQEDYPSARFMASAANREVPIEPIPESAGAKVEIDKEPPDGYVLTQRG